MESFVLEYERPTDVLKQRYFRKVDDEGFRLYVMDVRTPSDVPREVEVTLGRIGEVPKEKLHTYGELLENDDLRKNPIYDELMKQTPRVHSMIYVTRQEKEKMEKIIVIEGFEEKKRKETPTFGSTYIPYNVLEMTFGNVPKELAMRVEWL